LMIGTSITAQHVSSKGRMSAAEAAEDSDGVKVLGLHSVAVVAVQLRQLNSLHIVKHL